MRGKLRLVGWIAALLALMSCGMAGVVLRLSLEGDRAMVRSDIEFNQGRLRDSLLYAERAAMLYAPGLRHIRRADMRLDAIANGAESSHRQDISILAWQAIRTSEQQRRWWLGRPSDRARAANRRLAALLADDGHRGSLFEQQQFLRRVSSDLERRNGPTTAVILAQLASLCGITAGLIVIRSGLARRPVAKRWLWVGAVLAGVGAIAWAIFLALA